MAVKKKKRITTVKSPNQSFLVLLLVGVIVVFMWSLVQIIQTQTINTQSEAAIRNQNRRVPKQTAFSCNSRCDPASDSCPNDLICVDVNAKKKNYPPDYRCRIPGNLETCDNCSPCPFPYRTTRDCRCVFP